MFKPAEVQKHHVNKKFSLVTLFATAAEIQEVLYSRQDKNRPEYSQAIQLSLHTCQALQ